MNHRSVRLGRDGVLNHYDAPSADGPRPEAFREDDQLATDAQLTVRGDPRRDALFQALTAAAESGWDFSSRWLADRRSLSTIRTQKIVPVCLNSILLRYECDMARLYGLQEEMRASQSRHHDVNASTGAATPPAGCVKQNRFLEVARLRAQTMHTYLYSEKDGQWLDYDLEFMTSVTRARADRELSVCASNFFPLWAGIDEWLPASEAAVVQETAVRALRQSSIFCRGGVAATDVLDSSQQWDFPNAWPPVQLLLYDGLARIAQNGANTNASSLARECMEAIGFGFLGSMYAGWVQTGQMYEKYDAREWGIPGTGGEYRPQVGFGWTNGVALVLLESLAPHLRLSEMGTLIWAREQYSPNSNHFRSGSDAC